MKICHLSVNRKAIKNSHKPDVATSEAVTETFLISVQHWIVYSMFAQCTWWFPLVYLFLTSSSVIFTCARLLCAWQPLFFGRSVLQSQRNILKLNMPSTCLFLWSLLMRLLPFCSVLLLFENSKFAEREQSLDKMMKNGTKNHFVFKCSTQKKNQLALVWIPITVDIFNQSCYSTWGKL